MIQHFLRLIDEVETRIETLERMAGQGSPTITMISSNRESAGELATLDRWTSGDMRLRSAIGRIESRRAAQPIDQRLDITPRL